MTHPLSPTTVLPALVSLQSHTTTHVKEALQTLQNVYFPLDAVSSASVVPVLKQKLSEAVPVTRPTRTARLVHHDGVPDSGYASAEEEEEDNEIEYELEDKIDKDKDLAIDDGEALDTLRSDGLERGYAIKWLTGLIKRGDTWVWGTGYFEEEEARTAIIEDASRLLARFAGDDEPEEALTRTFAFPFSTQSRHADASKRVAVPPITVVLNDAPVDGTDHTAVGLQSWGSAIVFAERMCADPERYLGTANKLRVLELGAGTGLLSITASQIFSRLSVESDITATDYHPSVLGNLAENIETNNVNVAVEALDWCTPPTVGEPYDVVLAADVIYHPEHATWIRGCVERTLKKSGVFWLIIPLRTIGRHEGLGETVEGAFPGVKELELEGRGDCLAVVYREEVERLDGVGRADEGGYRLFEIRWM
ncbi:S-adenosyl-L-methionine-dependent methyltransferase [Melanogaster broomeanus]|nr:S-adenosyl-L-methionine-dependent methyltransferase [Melanogaster broomeanus]